MQLTISTDYGIRILLYLSDKHSPVSSQDLASGMAIPEKYVYKVCQKLKKNGLVSVSRGVFGGYCLLRPINEITLWDIICTMETKTKINRCLEEDCHCSREGTALCGVRRTYESLQRELEEKLSSITLEEVQRGIDR